MELLLCFEVHSVNVYTATRVQHLRVRPSPYLHHHQKLVSTHKNLRSEM